MSRTYGQICPMARSLEIIGERWTLLIVRDLLQGPRKFRDLTASLSSVAPAILSRRLKLLEDRGIVTRRMYSEHPPRAEYALTPSGSDLRTVVRALTIWGSTHLSGQSVLVHNRCDHPIEMAYRCAHCDRVLALAEIEYRTDASPKRRKASAATAVTIARGRTAGRKRSPAAGA
jgi:DNA-binding HxlR family transcriptional regulator